MPKVELLHILNKFKIHPAQLTDHFSDILPWCKMKRFSIYRTELQQVTADSVKQADSTLGTMYSLSNNTHSIEYSFKTTRTTCIWNIHTNLANSPHTLITATRLAITLYSVNDKKCYNTQNRATTNLEYSGISTNMENSGEFRATSAKIFNKQNSFSLIKYLRSTTRFWASNEQSLGDCHSALVMWNDP